MTSQSLPDRLLLVQVILMRTTDSYDTLPALLKDSNALTMTVPQSKARAAMQSYQSIDTNVMWLSLL